MLIDKPSGALPFHPEDYFRFLEDFEPHFGLAQATGHGAVYGAAGSGKISGTPRFSKQFLTAEGSEILCSVKDLTDVEEMNYGS